MYTAYLLCFPYMRVLSVFVPLRQFFGRRNHPLDLGLHCPIPPLPGRRRLYCFVHSFVSQHHGHGENTKQEKKCY